MLIVANRLREITFGKLMDIYQEGNLENGRERWPNETVARQLALAEEDFYNYLRQVFFKTEDAVYLIWEERGSYVSALRLEPYKDGWLLEALETAPDHRKLGHAKALMGAVLDMMGEAIIYSHVSRRNEASLKTHFACGFAKYLDHVVYLDGSVSGRGLTLRYTGKSK